jgi:flagellar basal-body rod modification protein FlgD
MTDISEIFTTPTMGKATPEYTTADSGADAMGKDDFLTLLVAQLQNQDPMNPDDPTEFTAQLAQFSSLEQLFNLNESMDALANTQMQSDRFSTMDLIGKEVVYADASFEFSGDPVNVGYQLDGTASSVNMSIQDSSGSTVATLHPTDMSKGDHFIEWNGLDDDGNELPPGDYKIILQGSSGTDNGTIAISPLVQSEVTGVDFSNETGEATIHTMAGAEIASSSIIAVYQPNTIYNKSVLAEDEEGIEDAAEDAVETVTNDVAGTQSSQTPQESASTDAEQIEQDSLQYFLAG